MGDLIENQNDSMALNAATQEAMACDHMDASQRSAAESMARSAASRAIAGRPRDTPALWRAARCGAPHGGHARAAHGDPGIAGLHHARGPLGQERRDRSRHQGQCHDQLRWTRAVFGWTADGCKPPELRHQCEPRSKRSTTTRRAWREADVLAELAYGTGGTFFQNNNDLRTGSGKIADVPEFITCSASRRRI